MQKRKKEKELLICYSKQFDWLFDLCDCILFSDANLSQDTRVQRAVFCGRVSETILTALLLWCVCLLAAVPVRGHPQGPPDLPRCDSNNRNPTAISNTCRTVIHVNGGFCCCCVRS